MTIDKKAFYKLIIDTNGNPSISDLKKLGYKEGSAVEMISRMANKDSKSLVDSAKKLLNDIDESLEEDYCDMYGCDDCCLTKDELIEFLDVINEKCPEGLEAEEIYVGDDGKTLEIVFNWDEYGQESVYKVIDVESIMEPSDLFNYADEIIELGKEKLGYVNDEFLNESTSSVVSAAPLIDGMIQIFIFSNGKEKHYKAKVTPGHEQEKIDYINNLPSNGNSINLVKKDFELVPFDKNESLTESRMTSDKVKILDAIDTLIDFDEYDIDDRIFGADSWEELKYQIAAGIDAYEPELAQCMMDYLQPSINFARKHPKAAAKWPETQIEQDIYNEMKAIVDKYETESLKENMKFKKLTERERTTKDVYVVQGNYGYGWDDLVKDDSWVEAKKDLKDYRENEPQYQHRIITRKEKNESLEESDDDNFKFNVGDTAYLISFSFGNGKNGYYNKVEIMDRWADPKWGNQYSLKYSDGSENKSCPEDFLLTKDEVKTDKGSVIEEFLEESDDDFYVKLNVEKGHTVDEYMDKYGDLYDSGELWDFPTEEIESGAVHPSENQKFWLIDDRYYEIPVDESLKESIQTEKEVGILTTILKDKELARDIVKYYDSIDPYRFSDYDIEDIYSDIRTAKDVAENIQLQIDSDLQAAEQEVSNKFKNKLFDDVEIGKSLIKRLNKKNESLKESAQPTNTKINIRESLNKMDWDTDNKYDLRNMYDSSNMTKNDKIELAKKISLNESYDKIYSYLKKFI